ncbi:uncharacterized protein AUP68_04652 [Ilyonectria robusta]
MTPLQSALLGISSTTQTRSARATNRSMLIPADEQTINMRSLDMAYAIGFLNQSFPVFTTRDYALLPYYVDDSAGDVALSKINRNWTAETTKLWAEFSCTPAIINNTNTTMGGRPVYNFRGKGDCTTNVYLDATSLNITVGYRDNLPDLLYNESDYKCTEDADTRYSALAYWYKLADDSSKDAPQFNITALHCDLSFHKQQVLATVTSGDLKPVDEAMEPLSTPTPLTSKEFYPSAYLYSLPLLKTAAYTNTDDFVNRNFPPMSTISNSVNYFTLNPIFRYAIAERKESVDVLSDSSQLESLVQGAHKYLFSLAITERLTDDNTPNNSTATSTFYLTGIVVSRAFSATLESLLLLIALMVGVVLYYTRTSVCALCTNPSSISQLVDLAHNSPEAAKLFRSMDTADDKLLASRLEGTRFQLAGDRLTKRNELITIQEDDAALPDQRREMPPRCYFKPIKPWVMRKGTGCAFAAVLVGCIIALAVLKAKEQKENGLPLPSSNFEVLQILENYIPTVIATLLESFWIFLTRTMCIFQPFADLCKGRSRAAKSIEATYASIPPQLALLKAINSQHIMLALLCLAAILGDVLAVSLGATFNEKAMVAEYTQEFQPLYQSQFNNDAIQDLGGDSTTGTSSDFLYMALANMSYDSQLSPWVSAEYFFQPHEIARGDKRKPTDKYTLRTRGFGVDANCTSIPASTHILKDVDVSDDTSEDASSVCAADTEGLLTDFMSVSTRWQSGVPATISGSTFQDTDESSESCTPPWSAGWARAPQGLEVNVSTIHITYAVCRPIFQTAMFDVTIDESGYVIEYERVGKIESTLNYSMSSNHTKSLFMIMNRSFMGGSSSWRNNTSTGSWLDELMVLETGSRDLLDPDLPVPDAAKLTPVLAKVYSRVFAAFLGVRMDFFEEAESDSSITGTRSATETRIFLDNTAFIISITILCIDLAIALAYYLPKTLYILPRVPTTIGSVLSYIVTSRAVKDGTPPSGWKDQTFSFGRYVGHNGKSYVGIELDPFVLHRDTSFKKAGT